ncbi:MAG: hypothetical protein JO283_03920 [Bradyrhizobium sp.]|nr:hypothetical protein [Bradyrhizobium sp.]
MTGVHRILIGPAAHSFPPYSRWPQIGLAAMLWGAYMTRRLAGAFVILLLVAFPAI